MNLQKFQFHLVLVLLIIATSCSIYGVEEQTGKQSCTQPEEVFCKHCKEAIFCISPGESLPVPCAEGETCNLEMPEICSFTPAEGCSCRNMSAGYIADPYDPHWYIVCIDTVPYFQECGEDEIFIETTEKCELYACTEEGMIPLLPECQQYLTCLPGPNGTFTQILGTCPEGTFFDDTVTSGDHCRPVPGPYSCPSIGAYADDYECQKYYICTDTGSPTDILCCLEYEYFDVTIATCTNNTGQCTEPGICYTTNYALYC